MAKAKTAPVGPITQDGDTYVDPADTGTEGEPEGDEDADPEPEPNSLEQRLAAIERENAELRGELRGIKSGRQPVAAVVDEEEPEPNWDEELFKDPKAAMKKHGEIIEKRITKALTQTYNKTTNEQQFWNGFYSKNPDLSEDRDLVQATLNRHMAEVADMPVEKAAEKLADLTRQRILSYRSEPVKGKKAVAEGSQSVTPKKVVKESAKILTLSDVIRNRRAARRGAMTGQKKGTAA